MGLERKSPVRLGDALARSSIARDRTIDKKSRKLNKLERILIEKVSVNSFGIRSRDAGQIYRHGACTG
jgi:hypothetical protein